MINQNVEIYKGGNFIEFNNGKGYWKKGLLIEEKVFSLNGYVEEPFTIRAMTGCQSCGNLLIKFFRESK